MTIRRSRPYTSFPDPESFVPKLSPEERAILEDVYDPEPEPETVPGVSILSRLHFLSPQKFPPCWTGWMK